jgi:STE24 endopeptidase
MTATRLLKAGAIILFAALWFVAAALLWRTRVPADLHLPQVDPKNYFSARLLDRAADFEGVLRLSFLVGLVLELATLLVLVFVGRRIAEGFELGRVGTGVMVGAFTTLMLWAVGLPVGFFDLYWRRHYGISRQGYVDWALEQWPSLLGQVVGLTILLTVLMLLAGRWRRYWWVAAAPLVVGITAALVFVIPAVERLGTHPVRDAALSAQIGRLADDEGVSGTKVRVQKVSDDTRAINASASGFGPTTVVLLWDTLFNGRLSDRAIKVVVAHELGHVSRRHILKGIAWSALLFVPLMFVLAETTRLRGGMHRPEVVPFALLVLTVLGLALSPAVNLVSRRYEAEADWMALEATRDPAAAREVFTKFTELDLAQPRPPAWSYVMLENHPTVVQRIGMANAWAQRRGP